MTEQKPIIVIGEGWAALGALGFLLKRPQSQADASPQKVYWVKGTGSRMQSASLSFDASAEAGLGRRAWGDLATLWEIETGEFQTGSFLREYRNKSFREPLWVKAPTPEARKQALEESLWSPERRFVGIFEGRFGITAAELEEELRAKIEAFVAPHFKKFEAVPVTHIHMGDQGVEKIVLGSGEEIEASTVIFADRWSSLAKIEGFSPAVRKMLSSTRKHDPMGILQAVFTHETPVGLGISEGFMVPLNKEAGEEMERRVWGYFSTTGKKSYWTICFSREEIEDNHEIAKKLRRMKAALDKAFLGAGWLGDEKRSFMSNVKEEFVRFEESAVFAGSSPNEVHADVSAIPKKLSDLIFLTDGFGPTYALDQVVMRLGLQQAEPKTEPVNVTPKAGSES